MDNGTEVKSSYAASENLIGVDDNYISQLTAEAGKLGSSFPLCAELLERGVLLQPPTEETVSESPIIRSKSCECDNQSASRNGIYGTGGGNGTANGNSLWKQNSGNQASVLHAHHDNTEIARVRSGQDKDKFIELHSDKPLKLAVKVRVPVKEFPKFNFVGKILGPKGNSLKRMQEDTGTRMAVFGRGSMRDRQKEEERRKEGGKFGHLNEDLHVSIEAFAHPVDCYGRLSNALHELRRHLVPDYNDEVTQSQVQELRYLNGEASSPVARGRGGLPARNTAPVAPGEFAGHRGGRGGMMREAVGGRGSGGGMGFGTYGGMMSMGRGGNVHPVHQQQAGAGTQVRPGSAGSTPGASFPEPFNFRRPY